MSELKKIPTRNGFGDEIVEVGKENPEIVVLDIDIGKSCKTGEFKKQLPDQYLNVGIAEQNGAGVAAGLFTIAANTGPLKDKVLSDAGASLVFPSMQALCDEWEKLFEALM